MDSHANRQTVLKNIKRFACYYGLGRLKDLATYDMVILQATHYRSEDLGMLVGQGVAVLAYLSVGEMPDAEMDERWALMDPHTGDRACNDAWSTTLVDCRSQEWHAYVLEERVPALLERGFTGLFLDTVDAHDRYPVTRPGMTGLLNGIRDRFPSIPLVVNRGFSVLDTVLKISDGIVFEAFTTLYANGRYRLWSPPELAWTSEMGQRIRRLGASTPVFTIDYAEPGNRNLRTKAERRATGYGFLPFVSTYMLDWLPEDADRR